MIDPIDAGIPEPIAAGSQATAAEAYPHAGRGALTDVVQSLLVTVLLAIFGTTFIVQAFKIPSESMEPTLLVGDHLLVNKFILEGNGAWYEKLLPYRQIRRGDVIIFKYPYEDHPDLVKRVIGLPGERLRIVNTHVYINKKPLDETYAVSDPTTEDPIAANFPPTDPYSMAIGLRPEWAREIPSHLDGDELVVPTDEYFVLGDNRDDSLDSRYWGFVRREAVIGRPVVIYWSVEATSDDYADTSASGNIAGIWQTLRHLPSQTRWHRIFREVH